VNTPRNDEDRLKLIELMVFLPQKGVCVEIEIVAAPTVVAAYTKRRKRVIIRDPEKELSLKTLAETPKVKDKGKGIMVETPKTMKKKDQIELDAEYAKKLHEEINKDY
nr:hypothetical protein [Tanacetum cinerariifolium]